VVGTRDLLTPVPSGRHLANLLPDADFVVLARPGHQLMQERPGELAELIWAFAAKLAGTATSVAEPADTAPPDGWGTGSGRSLPSSRACDAPCAPC